ncbi:MAG TPA: PilZ domain-containing protein [Desulfobacter sp.]|jgi:hypothetical protein|nr:PilZ domain-containing protein [Desulfobacter sp.]
MTIPTVYVNSDLTATFACESCGKSYTKNVSKFIEHKARVRLKYKCTCGHISSVILERRRIIRKEVQLKGELIQNRKQYPGVVTDISPNGIRFKTLEKPSIKVGNTAEVKFTLDNPSRSEVRRHIRIRKAFSEYSFGCEFEDTEHFDDLGKYFLFYF